MGETRVLEGHSARALGAAVSAAAICFVFAQCGSEGQAAPAANVAVSARASEPAAVSSEAGGSRSPAEAPRPEGGQAGVRGVRSPTLVSHPENIQAGLAPIRPLATVQNPREHDPRALEEGRQLFISYNCVDCHGADGSGAVGPSLQDGRWHFGGMAGEVYESIAEGRPDGMPAWGGRISDSQIWALVTYVRTLSAGHNVTTENFEGTTVPRSGH